MCCECIIGVLWPLTFSASCCCRLFSSAAALRFCSFFFCSSIFLPRSSALRSSRCCARRSLSCSTSIISERTHTSVRGHRLVQRIYSNTYSEGFKYFLSFMGDFRLRLHFISEGNTVLVTSLHGWNNLLGAPEQKLVGVWQSWSNKGLNNRFWHRDPFMSRSWGCMLKQALPQAFFTSVSWLSGAFWQANFQLN